MFRNSTKPSAESSTQMQGRKSVFLYLVIILSIAFNSLAVLTLTEYLSVTKVGKVSRVIQQPGDIEGRPSPINPSRTHNLLDKYFIYLLSAIVSGIPTCIFLVLLAKKLGSSREKTTVESAIGVEDDNPQPDVLAVEQRDNSATSENRTLGYNPNILLAKMSHELRSPLNAILGFAQMMEQDLSISQDSQKNVAVIHRNGEHLLSIVNDLVDLAKTEISRLTLENKDTDFSTWLDHLEQSFKFQAHSQNWQFSLIRQPDLPQYICIDDRRLRQILHNLINYCVSPQSSSSSSVSIRVDSEPIAEKKVETDGFDSAKQHEINFQIASADFPASDSELATLFDPLVRVQQEQKQITGSSLNLPLSLKLARLMRGDITVCAESGLESNLIFQLKIKVKNAVAVRTQIQSTLKRVIGLESGQTTYRILVVDDSKTNRALMSQLLESVGFQIEEAVNGQDAVDTWLRWQPHMIWMDLRMPVMNGYEATELIKSYSQTLHTPIVALSASTFDDEKSLLSAAGCDGFVGKPYSENVIFDTIAEHLDLRYVYEPVESLVPNSFRLTADALQVMPNSWLERVEQAAIVLDPNSLTQLLQEIPSEYSDLKNALQQQIDDFEYDRILDLVKSDTHHQNL